MHSTCPHCEYTFSRPERSQLFSGGPIKPPSAPCPSCGTSLRWALRPWRALFIGAALLIPAVFVSALGAWRPFLTLAAFACIIIALARLRLVSST